MAAILVHTASRPASPSATASATAPSVHRQETVKQGLRPDLQVSPEVVKKQQQLFALFARRGARATAPPSVRKRTEEIEAALASLPESKSREAVRSPLQQHLQYVRRQVDQCNGNWTQALQNLRDMHTPDAVLHLSVCLKHLNWLCHAWKERVAHEVVFPCREDPFAADVSTLDDAFREKYKLANFEQEFLVGMGRCRFAQRPEMHLPLSNWFVSRVFKSTHLYQYFAQPVDAQDDERNLRVVLKGKRGNDLLDGLHRIAQHLPRHLKLHYFTAPRDVDDRVHGVVRDDTDLSDAHLAATQHFLQLLHSAETWNEMERRMQSANTGAADRRSYALLVVREKGIFAQCLRTLSAYTFRPEFQELFAPTQRRRVRSALALRALR